jgi:hypothetical protein
VTISPNKTSEFWFTGNEKWVYRYDSETRQLSYLHIATEYIIPKVFQMIHYENTSNNPCELISA